MGTALRILAVATLPIQDDEAYYWAWSQHLQAGYLDHPPAVALLVAASTALFGHAPWALRLSSLVLAGATAWVLFQLTRELYGEAAAHRSQAVFHTVPLFFAGGVLVSPDASLNFLWAVATWAAWRGLRGEPKAWWVVGLAVGLGLQSKYSMAFLLPSLVVLILKNPQNRTAWPLCFGALLAALLFTPNLVWNAQHGWQAFRFVLDRPAWVRAGPLGNLALSVGGVLLYLSPLLAVLLVWAPWLADRPQDRFLRTLCVPTLLGCLVAAVAGKFKPHYLAPVALLGAPALAALETARLHRWRLMAVGLGALQSSAVLTLAVASAWHPAVLADQKGWDRVAERVLQLPPGTVLVTTTYQNAGQLAYALRGRFPVAVLSGPHTFDQWSPLSRYAGQAALLVYDAASPPADSPRWCRDAYRLPDVTFPDASRPLRTFVLIRCLALSLPAR